MRNRGRSLLTSGLAVVLFVFLLAPHSALAQGSGRPIGIGGKGSWNLSRIRGGVVDEPIDFNTGTGFSVGGLITFAASPNVTIQPEFLYSLKEVEALVIVDGILGEGEIETDWFEIPVLAKFHGERSQGVRPFALAGATLSFLVNAQQTVSAMDMTVSEDIKDELIGTDFGLTFGGGVDFLQDWGMITVDARYTFGLRRLGKDGEDDVKQDTFAVSGGIVF